MILFQDLLMGENQELLLVKDSFLYHLAKTSSLPDTPHNELSRRSAFIVFAVLIAFVAAPVFASVCVYLEKYKAALCPTVYSAIMIPSILFWTLIQPRWRRKKLKSRRNSLQPRHQGCRLGRTTRPTD